MAKTVALELDMLNDFEAALTGQGYRVVPLTSLEGADAVVISGMDRNVMGYQNMVFDGPVIDATGMTAAQVADELDLRFERGQ